MKSGTVRTKPTKYRDLDAAGCLRRYDRGRFLLGGITIALALALMTVFLTHNELSFGLYVFLLLLILLVFFIAFSFHVTGVYQILYTDCDPVKFLEVLKGQERKLKKPGQKSMHHLFCAMALVYLEDWDEVYRELAQFQAVHSKNKNFKYQHLNLLGDYCLVKDQAEDFEACRAQLLAWEKDAKPRQQKLARDIFRVWDRRIACLKQDRARERELLEQMLMEQRHYLIQETAWTFRLAQLDLLEGDLEQAEKRLRFVMEHGNTMAARAWAEELWNGQDRVFVYAYNQKRTGERNHGNDTE